MISKSALLLLAMVVVGIYVLPSVTARFAGSHTMEVNTTGGAQKMACGQCHQYIQDELEAGSQTDSVINAHRNATNDSAYMTALGLDRIAGGATSAQVCVLCHTTGAEIDGSHTDVTIRPCDSTFCHDYAAAPSTDNLANTTKLNVSDTLNNSADVHSGWYQAMVDTTDPLARMENGSDAMDAGYYTCLGCHTHVGIAFAVTRPQSINISLTINGSTSGWINVTSVTVNESDINVTTSIANAVSKWIA